MSTLQRTAFRTSRLLDFCNEKELVAQTGHGKHDWPLVVLKELVDNALDACEEGGIAPEVTVTVDSQGITVADNGPGLPEKTIHDMLDYNVRVSSREAYMAPDRGAQGNALKTILAMPYVLDGEKGQVVISAQGLDHTITFRVDRIRQEPDIEAVPQESFVRNGTSVRVCWPDSARSLLTFQEDRFLQVAADCTWLNPHLTLTLDWFGESYTTFATNPAWDKWKPNFHTCSHWYDAETLTRLISAYITHDQDAGQDRLVREFVAEFQGLTSTAKQKTVLESTGLARRPLSDLVRNGDVCPELAGSLLEAMQRETTPVRPERLGIIGKEHLKARFEEAGGDPDSFKYFLKKVSQPPAVYEFAFAHCPDQVQEALEERRLVTGVNWSAGIINPFRQLHVYQSLDGVLERGHCGPDEPIIIFLHVASPAVKYADRGKSAVEVQDSDLIIDGIKRVTKVWTRQREREKQAASARARRPSLFTPSKVDQKEACAIYMEGAYLKASAGGTLPATPRQVMYALRKQVQDLTGEHLDGHYFSQTILPDYVDRTGVGWDIAYDDRGHFQEPHAGPIIGLGTLSVRDYLKNGYSLTIASLKEVPDMVTAKGPGLRYGAILYIEKEGFLPLLETMGLPERYDVGLMSTKGTSVIASRQLADQVCHEYGIPLLLLRDFDRAGFNIAATWQRNTRRYTFKNKIEVIDLGLRLEDVEEYGLEPEEVYEKESSNARKNEADRHTARRTRLWKDGATWEEVDFLEGENYWDVKQRVELNAFTSDQMVEWLTGKLDDLQEQGVIGKVVPDADTLEEVYRANVARAYFEERVGELADQAWAEAAKATVPDDLAGQVGQGLSQDPLAPWYKVVRSLAT